MNRFKIIRYLKGLIGKESFQSVDELRYIGIKIGKNVDIVRSFIDNLYPEMIQIGDNVSISCSTILVHDASIKKLTGYVKYAPVIIGNNVFIGYGTIILPGVTIGENVIVGAGARIAHDVPSNSVVVGDGRMICTYDEYIARYKEIDKSIFCLDKLPWNLEKQERTDLLRELLNSGDKRIYLR